MFDSDSIWTEAFRIPNPMDAGRALGEVAANAQAAGRTLAQKAARTEPMPFDPSTGMQALTALGMSLWSHPLKAMELNARAGRDFMQLWTGAARRALGEEVQPVAEPARGDRRFKDAAWNEPGFDLVKQSYLLTARWLESLVAEAPDMDEAARAEAAFLVRQYLAAAAPTNFAATNPAVVRKTLQTGGLNLMQGAANLLADLAKGEGLVQRRAADDFELGVSIAATPGQVVFQNELMQLIQYSPSTDKVAKRPVLFVPPTVNKFYLFDLTPKSSFLKWLVDAGHTVFVISWVNPDDSHADKSLEHYVLDGPVAALDAIEQATGEKSVDLIGYCLGGTLTAVTLAYLAGKGQGERAASATLIATLTDFSELGEWSAFLGEKQAKAFDRYLAEKGYVESHDLAKLFSAVRANDLIWGPAVTHYLMGEEAPASDMLWWFNDGARMPACMLSQYINELLRPNALVNGGLQVGGVEIDLKAVQTPVFIVSMKEDHVSGWQATYKGAELFGGEVKFLLGGSGHNAGVINPPAANKHGFWTNEKLAGSAEAWLEGAQKQDGSWWPSWQAWLAKGQEQVPARKPGSGKLKPIEAAPGSYVRVRA